MRFDDSLDTVMRLPLTGADAIAVSWRQLVDLIGRRRGPARADAIARLHAIRIQVPPAVRRASARVLERADPPAELVTLFAIDELAVAGPVLRSARLTTAEWLAMLPAMMPAARGVLRLRSDLSGEVAAALAAFGPTDFALADLAQADAAAVSVREPASLMVDPADSGTTEPEGTEPVGFVPPERDPFVAVAAAARDLPVMARVRGGLVPDLDEPVSIPPARLASREDFEIAALVARIEAHQRSVGERPMAAVAAEAPAVPIRFDFASDASGLIRWVDGVERGPLIGLSLTAGGDGRPAAVDGVAAGALARRSAFADARLEVPGRSPAAGSWRISATPVFDRATGRFTGFHGVGRRPRPDEVAHAAMPDRIGDTLRQLVHELRTPANAIGGFAEMIEHQLLGPVAAPYRDQANTIRIQTGELLEAIDDLDTAARLDARRLDLRIEAIDLAGLVSDAVAALLPLAALRGVTLAIGAVPGDRVLGDRPALYRLITRLLTAMLASAGPGETLAGDWTQDGSMIALVLNRPSGFVASAGGLFDADAEADGAEARTGPLLGAGFGFRLARRLAQEMGGALLDGSDRLTLRLPAAVDRGVSRAAN